jgi:hypothetical protein
MDRPIKDMISKLIRCEQVVSCVSQQKYNNLWWLRGESSIYPHLFFWDSQPWSQSVWYVSSRAARSAIIASISFVWHRNCAHWRVEILIWYIWQFFMSFRWHRSFCMHQHCKSQSFSVYSLITSLSSRDSWQLSFPLQFPIVLVHVSTINNTHI